MGESNACTKRALPIALSRRWAAVSVDMNGQVSDLELSGQGGT